MARGTVEQANAANQTSARVAGLLVILSLMSGGLAVLRNLLCVSYTSARGKVFLFDLEERRLLSCWEIDPDKRGGYSDAGGVALDMDFNIFVADTCNNTVRRYSAFGVELGRLGLPVEGGPGAARRDRVGVLDRPRGVGVYRETVFVSCGERRLRCGLQRFHRDGRVLAPIRAFGESEGQFGAPQGLCVCNGELMVADTLNGAIQRFRLHGQYIGRFSTARGRDEASRPVALVPTRDGDLLVVDHGDQRGLQRFSISGEPKGEPFSEVVEHPLAAVRDQAGRIYVLDRDGERVLRFHADLSFDAVIVDLAEILYDP